MKKKKKVLVVLLVCIAVIAMFGAYIIVCGREIYYDNAKMFTNERTSDQVLTDWLTNDKHFDIDKFKDTYKIEEIVIESSIDQHKIPGSYIYAPGNTSKSGNTAIMVHGALGNHLSNYPMAQLFLSKGYNVITYDQRNSGGNTAENVTFGYLESNDTLDYIRYVVSEMDAQSKLGVWGQSMGAATVQNAMDDDVFKKYVNFVVLDCPLGNMEDMIGGNDIISKLKISYASSLCYKNLGFHYKDQRVYPQIENTTIPVMIFSSKADHRIPFQFQMNIYNAIKEENKRIYTVTDSEHSDIYFDHPEEYQEQIDKFLSDI